MIAQALLNPSVLPTLIVCCMIFGVIALIGSGIMYATRRDQSGADEYSKAQYRAKAKEVEAKGKIIEAKINRQLILVSKPETIDAESTKL